MRYPASEKLEIIRLVEQSHLGVGSTLDKLGIPKTTFYRWYDRFPNPNNRVDLETEEAVVAYAVEHPAHGQVRVSNELRKRGVFVSPSGVRSIWLRHDLAHCKARLKALEAKVAEEGTILTRGPNPGAGKNEIGRRGLGRNRHRASRLS